MRTGEVRWFKQAPLTRMGFCRQVVIYKDKHTANANPFTTLLCHGCFVTACFLLTARNFLNTPGCIVRSKQVMHGEVSCDTATARFVPPVMSGGCKLTHDIQSHPRACKLPTLLIKLCAARHAFASCLASRNWQPCNTRQLHQLTHK